MTKFRQTIIGLAFALPLFVAVPSASALSYVYPPSYTYPTYTSPYSGYNYGSYYPYNYGNYYQQPYYYPGYSNVDYQEYADYYQDLADYYEGVADYYENLADIQNDDRDRGTRSSTRTSGFTNTYYGGGYTGTPSYYYPSYDVYGGGYYGY